MKKLTKLLKIAMVPILILTVFVSLSVGILREVKKVDETSYSYHEYTLEGQTYSFRKYESKVCYVEGTVEVECQVDDNRLSVEVNEVKIDAIMAEDKSTISIPVIDPEADIEAEPTYLTFTKNTDPVVVTEQKVTIYSDYIVNFLGLNKFEELVGRHYFISIFCIYSGISFTTLIYLIRSFIKQKKDNKDKRVKKSKKPSKKIEGSLKVSIPEAIDVNSGHNTRGIKF